MDMSKECRNVMDLFLWMRSQVGAGVKTSSLEGRTRDLLISYSAKKNIMKAAIKEFGMDDKMLVFLEVLMAFALEDWRFFGEARNAESLANTVLSLLPSHGPMSLHKKPPVLKGAFSKLMQDCFGFALVIMTSSHISIGGDMVKDFTVRAKLDHDTAGEILNLFLTPEINPTVPPNLAESRLMEAAASHVGLSMS